MRLGLFAALLLMACSGKPRPAPLDRPVAAAAPMALDGTAWRLVSLDGHAPVSLDPLTLTFSDPGRVAGSAGINEYFGPTTATEPDGIRIGPLGSGRRGGPPTLLRQELTYLRLLQQVDRFQVADDQLELRMGPRPVLVFEPAD